MNAVIKPTEQPEQTDLSVILTMVDQLPADFYTNPEYEKELDAAIEKTNSLVYPLDDSGEKQAKADATSINKYANAFKSFINSTFKKETDEVGKWRDKLNSKVKLLLDNRQKLIDQHAEKRTAKLAEIKTMLEANLKALWESMDIKPEFQRGDISTLVKFSALTAGGSLTKSALTSVKTIAESCLAQQNKIEARHLLLENRCLRADINPPLTHIHLGTVFYADEAEFLAKVDELIEAEAARKSEMESRITKKLESENQQKIDTAVQQQTEQIAMATTVETPKAVAKEPEQTKSVSAHPASDIDDGKKSVLVTAQFRIRVRRHISAQSVANHLVDNKLSDDLKEALIECNAVDYA